MLYTSMIDTETLILAKNYWLSLYTSIYSNNNTTVVPVAMSAETNRNAKQVSQSNLHSAEHQKNIARQYTQASNRKISPVRGLTVDF